MPYNRKYHQFCGKAVRDIDACVSGKVRVMSKYIVLLLAHVGMDDVRFLGLLSVVNQTQPEITHCENSFYPQKNAFHRLDVKFKRH